MTKFLRLQPFWIQQFWTQPFWKVKIKINYSNTLSKCTEVQALVQALIQALSSTNTTKFKLNRNNITKITIAITTKLRLICIFTWILNNSIILNSCDNVGRDVKKYFRLTAWKCQFSYGITLLDFPKTWRTLILILVHGSQPIFPWFFKWKTSILTLFFSKKWSNHGFLNPSITKLHLSNPHNNHRIRWRIYWIDYPDQKSAQTPNKWLHRTNFRPRGVPPSNIPYSAKNHDDQTNRT